MKTMDFIMGYRANPCISYFFLTPFTLVKWHSEQFMCKILPVSDRAKILSYACCYLTLLLQIFSPYLRSLTRKVAGKRFKNIVEPAIVRRWKGEICDNFK